MPDETVIDGEIEELDEDGKVKRQELIERDVLPKLADSIRYSPILEGTLKDLMSSVKARDARFEVRNGADADVIRARRRPHVLSIRSSFAVGPIHGTRHR
jgi:hypothetical protein